MTKIVIITDTHYGIRNDNQKFHENNKKFFDEVFFPYIDDNDIKTVLHLGDVTDRRKYINFLTAKRLNDDFIQPILDRNLEFIVVIGNHDVYWKNTNQVNSMRQLYADKFKIVERPEEVNVGGLDMVLMPWICAETEEESFNLIENTQCQVLMGHLELRGYEMYKGTVNEHGIDNNIFSKFDVVCSGHYHHKSSYGNIHYLGSHAQFTWADHGDKRGFHVFDTDTRELEFIENPYEMFKKYHYDDTDMSVNDFMNVMLEDYRDSYVKLIVRNKTNPFAFDLLVDNFYKINVIDLQVVEDNMHLDTLEADEIIDEAQDTITILKKYIRQTDMQVDKVKTEKFIHELYSEALSIE